MGDSKRLLGLLTDEELRQVQNESLSWMYDRLNIALDQRCYVERWPAYDECEVGWANTEPDDAA